MSVAKQVKGFLFLFQDRSFCDDCIAVELRLKRRQQAQSVTASIASTGNFRRDKGQCVTCGKEKLVTRFSK